MTKEMIKPFAWGIVVGAIVLLIVIFSAGWVVTSSSAQTKAEEMAEEAVINRLAPICIAQILQDPKLEERLKEFKKIDSWQRGDYVIKQGWVTMPGEKEKEPDSELADEVAKRLEELKK